MINLPASPDEIVVAEPAVQETRKRRRRPHEEKKTYSKGKHPILPAKECSKSCKNNCKKEFSYEVRNKIHEEFWSFDCQQRRLWIAQRCNMCNKLIRNDPERKQQA